MPHAINFGAKCGPNWETSASNIRSSETMVATCTTIERQGGRGPLFHTGIRALLHMEVGAKPFHSGREAPCRARRRVRRGTTSTSERVVQPPGRFGGSRLGGNSYPRSEEHKLIGLAPSSCRAHKNRDRAEGRGPTWFVLSPRPGWAAAGDKGARIRCAGPDTRRWGAGGVQGGPFARGAQ